MDSSYTDNVLAEIEEEFQNIVKKSNIGDVIDEEEFQVVDSWEIGRVDDIHVSDVSYGKSSRRRKEVSYIRRREDELSRRKENRKNHSASYRRSPKKSRSKASDHHNSPRRSGERRTIERNSAEHIRVSVRNSPHRIEKLPDLKCTTSLETGEVNVVLLPEDSSAHCIEVDKEKSVSDSGRRKAPTLLKNPFACAIIRRKVSISPDRVNVRETEVSPRCSIEKHSIERHSLKECSIERHSMEKHSMEKDSMEKDSMEKHSMKKHSMEKDSMEKHSLEKHRRESRDSRSYDSRKRDRSLSPVRSKSNRRASPYYNDERKRRRSFSRNPERYRRRRRSRDYRRSRESSRRYSRSRDGSVLSRVSSRSSLSFISMKGNSPHEHDRKRSPLRPNKYYGEPRQNKDIYFSSSEDFNHKLNLLLREGKYKQPSVVNESEPSHSSAYNNSTWKVGNWNIAGSNMYPQPQDTSVNYVADAVKPYDPHQAAQTGYSQDQYNQVYYNNQNQNYPSTYTGSVENSGQFSYNYGNQYSGQIPNQIPNEIPNQIPNQYYSQPPPAINYPSTSYTDHSSAGRYLPMGQSALPIALESMGQPAQPVVLESMPQPQLNVSQQQYPSNVQNDYVGMNPLPAAETQSSAPAEPSQNKSFASSNTWQSDYVGMNPLPAANTQPSSPAEPSQNKSFASSNAWQSDYVRMNPLPAADTQPSEPAKPSKKKSFVSSNTWSTRGQSRVPTRTSIPLTQNEAISDEEDVVRTPPPPAISDTWREIESVEDSSLKGANNKWKVLGKCEKLLQKLISNDPSMECFKFPQMMHFSVQEETKNTPNLISKSAVRAARRLAKTLRFQSPLLRKGNNANLKFAPWMPEG